MRFLLTAALFIAAMLAGSAHADEPLAVVTLPASVEVDSLRPRLGQVARVESRSPSLADRLLRIALPPLDPAQKEYTLSRKLLAGLIADAGVAPSLIAFAGAPACTVIFPGVVYTDTDIRRFIADELDECGINVELIVFREFPPLASTAPSPALTLVFPTAEGEHLPSALRLVSGERHLQTVSLRNHLKFRVQALHTVASVYRGASVLPGNFQRGVAELLPGAGLLTTPPEDGMEWRVDLPAGVQVLPSYLYAPPLVGRGDIVTVKFAQGAVSAETTGTALSTGSRGQTVTVRLPSGAVIRAVVTGPGTVSVGETEENDA
jgi:flagella basal body P-ring formation protein FlgA